MDMFDNSSDNNPHLQLSGPNRDQTMRFGCGCISIIALIVVILSILTPYTNYLWFAHDAQQLSVFTTSYKIKGLLFAVAFIIGVIGLSWSMSRAVKVSLVYIRVPATLSEALMSNTLNWIREKAPKLSKILAVVIAFFLALGFSSEWNTYLLATHAQSFGMKDPTFGLDLGFFVFSLPWLLAMVNYLLGLAFLITCLTIGIYVGMQVLASIAKIELGRPQVRIHVSVLIGVVGLLFAAQMWLRRFEVGLIDNAQFTGAGYAGIQQLHMQTIAAVLVALFSLATILTSWVGKPYRVPIVGGVLYLVWSALAVMGYPTLVQRLKVEPDLLNVEAPYAQRAIKMTRFAYNLDQIETQDVKVTDEPTPQEYVEAKSTLDNMRLWDPEILRQSIDVIQTLKGYYQFNDVDIDRYMIDGKQTLMMVSARDINPEGLDPKSRSWVTERMKYTHGFGITMSPVNTASSAGQPTFAVKDIPPIGLPDLKVSQPRIYFSDFRDAQHNPTDQYMLVRSNTEEFDYPIQNETRNYRWTGTRGIPCSGPLARVAFSILFQDINPIFSQNITKDTRLLMHRSVIERAHLIYPFLQLDQDPYVVLVDGKLMWILDGYTTSSQIPYSGRLAGTSSKLNYIRNSVKITIDAYSGETIAYAVDQDDPILKAYRSIYPGLVKNRSEMPKGIVNHLRYPEDLFKLQSSQITQYHVLDPQAFLNNSDAWELPYDRGLSGEREAMRPYYVQMRLPGEPKDSFLLILPFSPRQKINMSGWLAAHCDPDSYGKLVLYKYPEGSNMPGPAQMESMFNQDKVIADINRQLNNDQSKLIPGNSLVVPIGNSVIYVEPLFLQSKAAGIAAPPELKKIILATKNGPVVGDTYEEALRMLIGGKAMNERASQPTTPKTIQNASPTNPSLAALKASIREANRIYEEAQLALKNGDFAKYGELAKKLGQKLKEINAD
jgi:uncharacterized membrane protein (UPF0182 family)